jgi:hypothetical protein
VQLWELQVCSHWTAVQVANGINLVRRCLPAKGINGSANAMLKKNTKSNGNRSSNHRTTNNSLSRSNNSVARSVDGISEKSGITNFVDHSERRGSCQIKGSANVRNKRVGATSDAIRNTNRTGETKPRWRITKGRSIKYSVVCSKGRGSC